MHDACIHEQAEAVSLLLKRANVCALTVQGRTPLIDKVTASDNTKIVEMLVKHEDFVDVTNEEGYGALHHCAWIDRPLSAAVMLQNGADPNMASENQVTPSQFPCLTFSGE